MKKFLPLLSLFLVSAASASSVVPCKDLDPSAFTSDLPITCSVSGDYAGKQQLETKTFSPNGKPSQVIFNNKGGYVAWMMIDYYTPNGQGGFNFHKSQTRHLGTGSRASLNFPADAENLSVKAVLNTQVSWHRNRTIFTAHPRSYDNVWTANDNSKNIMQWDVWGTTFNSPHAIVRPSNTHRNQ